MRRIFIAFAVVCVVTWMIFGNTDAEKNSAGDVADGSQWKETSCWALTQSDIAYSARFAVRGFLSSPGAAWFPSWPDESYRITEMGDDAYIVSGEMSAKKSAGVTLRTTWRVRLKFTGRGMETVNISEVVVGDQIIYNAP